MNFKSHEEIVTGEVDRSGELTETYGKPIWRGETEPIRLLVNCDFGIGDTIQYFRYCNEAKSRVTELILRCDEDLHTLFEPYGYTLLKKDEELPEFDKISHIMALPKALGKKYIEPTDKYLSVNYDKNPKQGLLDVISLKNFSKIGICWAGNQFSPRSIHRDLSPYFFENCLPKMPFLSLQKQFEPPKGWLDCRGIMRDFNQTAALLERLELIITVDTAIAHLAGALGVRTWLLLGQKPDPRWNEFAWKRNERVFGSVWEGSIVDEYYPPFPLVGDRILRPRWYSSIRIFEGEWEAVRQFVQNEFSQL